MNYSLNLITNVRVKLILLSSLAYIILDEANLSPIEHYWSTFYNLTDSTAKHDNFLSIQLGNNLNLEFANNLRFIATINYDQTTGASHLELLIELM